MARVSHRKKLLIKKKLCMLLLLRNRLLFFLLTCIFRSGDHFSIILLVCDFFRREQVGLIPTCSPAKKVEKRFFVDFGKQ